MSKTAATGPPTLAAGAVAVLARLAWRRHDGSFHRSLDLALVQARLVAPRIFCAVLGAGFIAALVPPAACSYE